MAKVRFDIHMYFLQYIQLLYFICSNSPNDGFLEQLELFEVMGYKVDVNHQAFKQYRLTNLARHVNLGLCSFEIKVKL